MKEIKFKKIKFKDNSLSFKKFNQIIFEDNSITKTKYFGLRRPDNWHNKKIKRKVAPHIHPNAPIRKEMTNIYYKGKLVNGKYEGFGMSLANSLIAKKPIITFYTKKIFLWCNKTPEAAPQADSLVLYKS